MENERKPRLFVDMDGTLAVFNRIDKLETLYERGYFADLTPQANVVEAVRILQARSEVEVFVLSAVLTDSKYAQAEKNEWLNLYLPEIDESHRIFVPCGEDKTRYVPERISEDDVLLDDYTVNLNAWEPPAKGLKLLNGINGTKGTWQKSRISVEHSADELADMIADYVLEGKVVEDRLPQQHSEEQEISYIRMSEIADAAIDLLLQEDSEENFAALDEAVDLSIDEMSRWHMHDMFDLHAEHRPMM
ncbi:MAG: hypothetical protein EGR77_01830 [Pseudobutyrivibrio sp.]|nr:hypothetical protein [Pseudobutyrivibrio sp.]